MTEPRLTSRRDGEVLVVTLDRPDRRNALDRVTIAALDQLLSTAQDDHTLGAVVITGAPPAFCAGADLDELKTVTDDDPRAMGPAFESLLETLATTSVPLLAAVNGAAVGLGATLLLHCDAVVVAASARIRFPFVVLGVTAEAGSADLLPRLVGRQQAARLLLTGAWVEADEAVRLGLALASVADGAVVGRAVELAQEIAAQPREASRTTKRLLAELRYVGVDRARTLERTAWRTLQHPRPTDPR